MPFRSWAGGSETEIQILSALRLDDKIVRSVQPLYHWARILTPVVAFGGLFAGIQMGRPSWRDAPPGRPVSAPSRAASSAPKTVPAQPVEAILGFLDMRNGKPVVYAKANSRLEVSGWTACSVPGSKLDRVAVLIDEVQRGEVREFFSRPDVATKFGRPDFEMSGWKTVISLTDVKPGEHSLIARGFGSRGETGSLPAFRLHIFE